MNKIAVKLTICFSSALVLFSVIIGSVFMTLFKEHTVNLVKAELEKRAVTMADTLSEYTGPKNGMGAMSGYGAYLRLLDKIAMTDAWVVDEELQLITIGRVNGRKYQYEELPPDAEAVVKEVIKGNTTFSEGFSALLNAPTLTVGTPIRSGEKIIGALLLHSPVEGTREAVDEGFRILSVSILIALILSFLLSVMLSVAFTAPLKKMKNSALLLSAGDYSARTGVKQKDEIGELAFTIDSLSERLSAAACESERLEKLRRDFIAGISHELRTPVTVIRGSLEALCDEVVTDPGQVKDYHRQMLNESIFLQRLVNDLLDLTRLQNSDFKIETQKIGLSEVLRDAVRSAQHVARQKNIEIALEQERPVYTVTGDYGRLRQMFLIILDNAVKFSPPDSTVTVSLSDRTVRIRDNGIGISQDDLPYIFDRFYRAKSEENKNGTGLGLAIAKQIADRHHIRVSVSSRIHEGTEFCFQL